MKEFNPKTTKIPCPATTQIIQTLQKQSNIEQNHQNPISNHSLPRLPLKNFNVRFFSKIDIFLA